MTPRRWLGRFPLPAELRRHRCPCPRRPDAPSRGEKEQAAPAGCREPKVAGAAAPERPRRAITVTGGAGADGGRRSRSVLLLPQGSPFRSTRPHTLGRRVMPPLFPSSCNCNSFEVVDGLGKERQPEEEGFSHHSERAVYKEYLQSIHREYREQDLPEGLMSVPLYKHQTINIFFTGPLIFYKYDKADSKPSSQIENCQTFCDMLRKDLMALDWMLFRENSSHCAGGILADEQGLGKTIEVIALILKERPQQSKFMSIDSDREATVVNKEPKDETLNKIGFIIKSLVVLFRQKPACHVTNVKPYVDRTSSIAKSAGGTLMVCPKCILTQWNEELSQKITKDAGLSVLVYHGCSKTMDSQELTKHDVVITTYQMVKQHFTSRKKGVKKKLSASNGHNSNPIAGVRWFRIVLDEAHEIKNCDSLVAQACWELEAERRWCISGTPMQNKFGDLYSYLRFLRYKPYSEHSSFRSLLKKQNSTYASRGKTKLEILLGIVLLRRTKELITTTMKDITKSQEKRVS
ncbi:unnamed protein product [Miscanthus lutarioriparius]|uniref:Helicase ATP-binding domain-containing protein n=1 Tax=Miscanthus lutarioriparius TaxID=422564 RepID=A0A811QZZ7_9POAL|nr:unnamed protein product [Miscanthus lutarioriparius]